MNRVAHFLGNYIASKLNYDQDRREIIITGPSSWYTTSP